MEQPVYATIGSGVVNTAFTVVSVSFGAPQGLSREGGRRGSFLQAGEVLTGHVHPTAVRGGASWAQDPAPHRAGRDGWMCHSHDHRPHAAGECWGGWEEEEVEEGWLEWRNDLFLLEVMAEHSVPIVASLLSSQNSNFQLMAPLPAPAEVSRCHAPFTALTSLSLGLGPNALDVLPQHCGHLWVCGLL